MKKNYVKPVMGLDLFSLTQSIAETCDVERDAGLGKPNHYSKASCGWYLDDDNIVFVASPTCNSPWGADDPFGALCYNNPEGGTQIFGS